MPPVLLLKSDYDRAGGPETLLCAIASTLDRERFSPVLGVLRRPGQRPAFDYPSSLPQIEIPWRGGIGMMATVAQIAAAARRSEAALLHTHDMRANAAARVFRSIHRMPWIAHVHGWLGSTHRGRWLVYEAIDRCMVRGADLVLAGSSAAEREVRDAGVRRAAIVPNFVVVPTEAELAQDADSVRAELGVPPAAFLAGVLGRVHPGKGQHIFVAALADLVRRGIEVRGVIVGEGPHREYLQELAGRLGVADILTLTGHVADPGRYLRAADAIVVPSLKDSLPLVAMEAMSFGRPVVASRAGDLPVLLNEGEFGLLFPVGDAAALSSSLARLAKDPDLRRELGAKGRQRVVEAHSAETITRRLEAQYADVLRRYHGAPRSEDADSVRPAE